MKILFGSPDRDLLECYKTLLCEDFGQVVTAFDGTQVISLISAEAFDIAILDRDLPRIPFNELITRIKEKNIPVINMTNESVNVRRLTEEAIPNSYIYYPFTLAQIGGVITELLNKSQTTEILKIGDLEIIVSKFRIKDGPFLTLEEINVLQSLLSNKELTVEDGAYISSLNAKLIKVGSKTRIKYRSQEGFIQVNENE